MKIENISLGQLVDKKAASRPEKKPVASFNDMLTDSIHKMTNMEKDANNQVEKLTKMETQDVHNTMIAMEKADLNFHLMMQVRNKIISAYEEIMRMQV